MRRGYIPLSEQLFLNIDNTNCQQNNASKKQYRHILKYLNSDHKKLSEYIELNIINKMRSKYIVGSNFFTVESIFSAVL